MLRKVFLAGLLVLALLFVVGAVGAQGEELPPGVQPIALVAELGNLLGLLLVYAAFGSAALAYLKPVLLNRLQEQLSEQPNLYLSIVYTIRLIGGALTLALFGGVVTLYQSAPSLLNLPLPPETRDAALFVGAVFILSLGQEGIYVILNLLRSLAGMPTMGSPSAQAEEVVY